MKKHLYAATLSLVLLASLPPTPSASAGPRAEGSGAARC